MNNSRQSDGKHLGARFNELDPGPKFSKIDLGPNGNDLLVG